jgi:hypothetical protein
MMESETPSPASSPNRADDSEVSSRRAPPDQQVVQESRKELPEGGASVVRGSGVKNNDPKLSGSPPETALEASKRIPSKECCTPAADSEDPAAPEMLTDMLRQASISEEHRALMGTVVEKVLSAKSGLDKAFTSLLRGFEVCDVILPIE